MIEDDATHVEPLELQDESVADDVDLGGDDGQHGGVDAVELVKAAPGSTLRQTGEDLPNRLQRKRKASIMHHQKRTNKNRYVSIKV